MAHYQWQQSALFLRCHLQPKASNSEFAGLFNDRLKIRIAAPPVDGKANTMLVRFLSDQFSVPRSHIEITRGQNNREKTVKILSPKRLPLASKVKCQ